MAGNAWVDLLARDGATVASYVVNDVTSIDVEPSACGARRVDLTLSPKNGLSMGASGVVGVAMDAYIASPTITAKWPETTRSGPAPLVAVQGRKVEDLAAPGTAEAGRLSRSAIRSWPRPEAESNAGSGRM
ncbi:hypothetical protein [Streptomyces phaeoluteigriseus]|uniref:hypothetical protein n=1 Tax=Streptomyces phaeoluteigriseus TaxID=114686 RepID=UPI00117F54E7|nr:hypothetical protein [Streptomyces phaeoluteigriseus]